MEGVTGRDAVGSGDGDRGLSGRTGRRSDMKATTDTERIERVLSAPAPGLRPGVCSRSGTSGVVQYLDGSSTRPVPLPPEATRTAEQQRFILLESQETIQSK